MKEFSKCALRALIANFEVHHTQYLSSDYKEASLRVDFLNKFFALLGWDVTNEIGLSPSYREVVTEDSVQIDGKHKSPDYSFRGRDGARLFFAEAKKPSVKILNHDESAFQLRRYGWSAGLGVSILTNFEHFAVYDCSIKPNERDDAKYARLRLIHFKDYLNEFDYLWDTFSKEAVLKGSLYQFQDTRKSKRGSASVDKDFVQSLDGWRVALAKDIHDRNDLDEDQLNLLVQIIIDRIIFLRIAEDRNIEDYGSLFAAQEGQNVLRNLTKIFETSDKKYSSGLFKFNPLFSRLKISDSVLRKVILGLYYPLSPYEFSVLPIEIIGKAYEQFLGKKITITSRNNIKIEDKPEVRKSGGVFYTQRFIVQSIVNQTVRLICLNKTPLEVARIKILDPACGSGSFLICAFEFLLGWHKDYFSENKSKLSSEELKEVLTPTGDLTSKFKTQILVNNIFGIDIDANAVEVTKLSLLLKCLEGETKDSLHAQFAMFNEQVLPTLDENIRCGNSLIDFDIYARFDDFSDDIKVKKQINAFNWSAGFRDVIKSGGFDAIIGNPPWGAFLNDQVLNYLKAKNSEIVVRMVDTYMYFCFALQEKLKDGGLFGMILPDVMLYQIDNWKLRKNLLDNTQILRVLNVGSVFEGVTRPASIVVFQKIKPNLNEKVLALDVSAKKSALEKAWCIDDPNMYCSYEQGYLLGLQDFLFVTKDVVQMDLFLKIGKGTVKSLGQFIDPDGIQRGVSPDFQEAFLVDRNTIARYRLEKQKLKPILTGGVHVKRFAIRYPSLYVIYTSRTDDFAALPNIRAYIDLFKNKIKCKEVIQKKHSIYALHRARKEEIFTKETKIVGVITADRVIVALDTRKTFASDGLFLFGVADQIDPFYLVGVLNSKVFSFIYRLVSMEKGRVLAQVKPTILCRLPIPDPEVRDPKRQKKISEVISAVKKLMTKFEADSAASSGIDGEVDFLEDKIDSLVFELYGLTKQERLVIERSFDV